MFRSIVFTSVLVALLMAVGWYWQSQATIVDIATVTRGSIIKTVVVEGMSQASNRSIITATAGGLLQRIDLQLGQAVQAGTVVAVIEPVPAPLLDSRTERIAEARVQAARAEWLRASAGHELALANLKQVQKKRSTLNPTNSSMRPLTPDLDLEEQARKLEVDAAQRALDRSKYEWDAARAQLGLEPHSAARSGDEAGQARDGVTSDIGAKEQQTDSAQRIELCAMSPGQVLRILQRDAPVVAPGTPLLEIGDLERLEFVFDVLTQEATCMRIGTLVEIRRWDDQDNTLRGKVRFIEPASQKTLSPLGVEELRTRVWVELSEREEIPEGLGHGYRIEGVFQLDEVSDVLKVPVGAIFRQDGQWYVFRIKGGRAIQTSVQIGLRNEREACILGGLSDYDPVVLYPANRIQNGMPVMVR